MMTADNRLRLIAMDGDDLAIVSAHVQDSVLKAGDLLWLPAERRFVVTLNRFAHEARPKGLFARRVGERRRAALDFARVSAVRSAGFDREDKETVLSLLALRFEPGDPPSGTVELVLAGGASIRLDVECIEARLSDLGPAWATPSVPKHPVE